MIDDKDILAQEIQSCDSCKYALKEENTLLSNKILKEGQKEEEGSTKAVNFKRSEFHRWIIVHGLDFTITTKNDK